jgi:putative transcriptional regulator
MGEISLAGRLLLSAPSLLDPNFRRSVVLVVAHDEEGALGLVLDRPTRLAVAQAAPALAELVDPEAVLHRGGPVRATAVVILARYRDGGPERAILPGVGLLTTLDAAAIAGIERVRVFAGYAGWGAGQLEVEVASGAWLMTPARAGDPFVEPPSRLWRLALRRLGTRYLLFSTLTRAPRLD